MQTEQSKCSYVVAKVVSRCNLNCSYCYMYNLGDKTYLNQPKVMRDDVVEALLTRIRNHCQRNTLNSFLICFHGGEPLLAGRNFFRRFMKKADSILGSVGISTRYVLQTNAVLLDDAWCRFFSEHDIGLSISVDGTKEIHDEFRVDHKGRGSYEKVARGLACAQDKIYNNMPGVLSVINLNADAVSTYDHFVKSLNVKWLDFLFPDANYDKLPGPKQASVNLTPYGDWLIEIFDKWIHHKGADRPKIRIFDNIIRQILGFNICGTDAMGSQRVEVLVIETNGGIEAVDVLKVCGDGFTKGAANVLTNEFEDAFQEDLITMYEQSHRMLCGKCMACPVKNICGGGYLPHRYSSENGFNNPSIYCQDILKLISHIQNKLVEILPASFLQESKLEPFTYADLVQLINSTPHESPYTAHLESFRSPLKGESIMEMVAI